MVTIGDLNRDQLLTVLGSCVQPIQNNETYVFQHQNATREYNKNMKRNSSARKGVALVLYGYNMAIWCGGILGGILGSMISDLAVLGGLLGGVGGIAAAYFLWKKRNQAVEKKMLETAQMINAIQTQIEENIRPVIDMYRLIPTDCCDAYSIGFLYNVIYSGRASNFADARNILLADQRYREEMAQRKYQIDKEYQKNLVMAGAIAQHGKEIGRGLNNIAESNRDRMRYW